jgi:hypothetical protein
MSEARIISMLQGIGVAVAEIRTAVGGLRESIGVVGQSLALMNETLRVQGAVLDSIHKACTADVPPSRLEEPLRQLVAAAQETNATLRDIGDAIEAQPEAMRQAVSEALNSKDDE